MRALDLFSGAGGWDVAARELGIECDGVENMPEARATRDANGLWTLGCGDVWDVADQHLPTVRGQARNGLPVHYDGLIASPPCQTFSMAGKGAGRKALENVLRIIESGDWKDVARLRLLGTALGDERTALVLTPLLFWHHMRPKWVAFEQVPTVLPVWEAMADVMREAGYSVWTGNLHAEQYGVPQTRKRAILMASQVPLDEYGMAPLPPSRFIVEPPTPTHSKYHPRDKTRLDPGVKPWVSMAEALGWTPPGLVYAGAGETAIDTAGQIRRNPDEPVHTVTGKGTAAWVQDRQLGQGRLERHGKPQDRTTDEPSYAMRGQASGSAPGGGYVLSKRFAGAGQTAVDTAGQVQRELAEPAHTVTGKATAAWVEPSRRVTVEEAAILQGFPKDFVFCGGKGKQYLQVGNAIPPPLARAILQSVTLSGKLNA